MAKEVGWSDEPARSPGPGQGWTGFLAIRYANVAEKIACHLILSPASRLPRPRFPRGPKLVCVAAVYQLGDAQMISEPRSGLCESPRRRPRRHPESKLTTRNATLSGLQNWLPSALVPQKFTMRPSSAA